MDPATDWVSGKHGKSLDFDGSDDYIAIGGDEDTFDVSAAGASIIFTYVNGGEENDILWSKWYDESARAYDFAIKSLGRLGVQYSTTGADSTTIYSDLSSVPSEPYWAAVVFTTSIATFYVNGQSVGSPSLSGAIYNNAMAPVIGKSWNSAGYFPGSLGACLFYNRALSPQEIKTLYQDPWCLFQRNRFAGINTEVATTRYWVGTSTSWNDSSNWSTTSGGASGASVPGANNEVTFDGQSTQNCTCDVAISVKSLTVEAGYTGTLDFADSAYSHTIAEDATFDGGGTVDCGDATITCSGNWDAADQTTWTRGTSTIVLDGTDKTMDHTGNTFQSLTISGSYTSSTGTYNAIATLSITGTLTVTGGYVGDSGGTVSVSSSGTLTATDPGYFRLGGDAAMTVDSGATIEGTGTLRCYDTSSLTNTAGTTITLECRFYEDSTISGGTYTNLVFFSVSNGTVTAGTAASQTITALGNVSITTEDTWGISGNTHNPDWVIQGDLTFAITSGTLTWTKGTGSITFSGTGNQTITTPGSWTNVLEDITINKTSGRLNLAGDIYTDSLTFTDGDLDLNGNTIDSAGNVTINGNTGARFWNGVDEDMSSGTIDIASGTLTLQGSA
jgi:hypothetical protein